MGQKIVGEILQMKTTIFTVTYDKDLEYLKYNLMSVKKFCRGYHENVVVIDDYEKGGTKTRQYLDSIGQKYHINREAERIKKGYIRQQYIKLFSEQYVSRDTDYICHIDSDTIFTDYHDPSIYFKNGKPIIGIQKWSQSKNNYFKSCTDETLEFESEYNFMRRMPLVYNFNLFAKLRQYISNIKGEIIDYLNTLETISEFNLLGAYAYKFTRESFYWIDIVERSTEWKQMLNTYPCKHNSSHTESPRYIEVLDLRNFFDSL